jgi:hypothetical protein
VEAEAAAEDRRRIKRDQADARHRALEDAIRRAVETNVADRAESSRGARARAEREARAELREEREALVRNVRRRINESRDARAPPALRRARAAVRADPYDSEETITDCSDTEVRPSPVIISLSSSCPSRES